MEPKELKAIFEGDENMLRKFAKKNMPYAVIKNESIDGPLLVSGEVNVASLRPHHSSHLAFEECIFKGNLSFAMELGVCKTSLSFRNCTFLADLDFSGGNFEKYVRFENCSIPESLFSFKGGIFSDFKIEKGEYKEIGIYSATFTQLDIGAYLQNTFIKELFINCSKASGKIDLYNLVCYEANVVGILNENGTLNINECYFENLLFKNFTNNGKLRIRKPVPLYYYETTSPEFLEMNEIKRKFTNDNKMYSIKLFFIENSVMGKAEFFSIDFQSFRFVYISESSLIDIIISNVKWPDHIYRKPSDIGLKFTDLSHLKQQIQFYRKGKRNHSVSRENYRQLKFACGRQSDFIGEQHFHSLEMRAYNISLSWSDKILTKLILKLSYWTSDYGQSIKKPIVSLILGHLLLFLIALYGGGFENLQFTTTLFAGMESGIEKYLTYINPLRNASVSLPGYLMIVDITMRIWSSYMIYNIIRASRRFIK